MSEKCVAVQSFHEVIQGVIIGVIGQVGPYMEPPGEVVAEFFALSLNAAHQIEDGNHADELGSLLSRRADKAGGFAVIFHLYILHKGRFGWALNFSDLCRQTPRRDPTSILPRTYPARRRSVWVLMLSDLFR